MIRCPFARTIVFVWARDETDVNRQRVVAPLSIAAAFGAMTLNDAIYGDYKIKLSTHSIIIFRSAWGRTGRRMASKRWKAKKNALPRSCWFVFVFCLTALFVWCAAQPPCIGFIRWTFFSLLCWNNSCGRNKEEGSKSKIGIGKTCLIQKLKNHKWLNHLRFISTILIFRRNFPLRSNKANWTVLMFNNSNECIRCAGIKFWQSWKKSERPPTKTPLRKMFSWCGCRLCRLLIFERHCSHHTFSSGSRLVEKNRRCLRSVGLLRTSTRCCCDVFLVVCVCFAGFACVFFSCWKHGGDCDCTQAKSIISAYRWHLHGTDMDFTGSVAFIYLFFHLVGDGRFKRISYNLPHSNGVLAALRCARTLKIELLILSF